VRDNGTLLVTVVASGDSGMTIDGGLKTEEELEEIEQLEELEELTGSGDTDPWDRLRRFFVLTSGDDNGELALRFSRLSCSSFAILARSLPALSTARSITLSTSKRW
jgi:hypothetical protein